MMMDQVYGWKRGFGDGLPPGRSFAGTFLVSDFLGRAVLRRRRLLWGAAPRPQEWGRRDEGVPAPRTVEPLNR